jgi:hypothetical protein
MEMLPSLSSESSIQWFSVSALRKSDRAGYGGASFSVLSRRPLAPPLSGFIMNEIPAGFCKQPDN